MYKFILFFTTMIVFFSHFTMAQQANPITFGNNYQESDYRITAYFNTSEHQQDNHAESNLEKQIAPYLSKDIIRIELVGHADLRGTDSANRHLSERRSKEIKNLLLKHGFQHIPISLSYRGEEEPAILGNDENAYKRNRRVEIVFTVREIRPKPYTTIYNPTKIDTFRYEADAVQIVETPPTPPTEYELFFNQLDQAAESKVLNTDEGGIIKGRQGTLFHFNKNSFCDCTTKQEIAGEIELKIKEYYRLGDFMKAGLHTVSMNRNLRSAGTVHIQAFQNGKEICLKKGINFDILSPVNKMNDEIHPDMNLFTGVKNEIGEVEWKVMGKNRLSNEELLRTERNGTNRCEPRDLSFDCPNWKFFKRVRYFIFKHEQWRFNKNCNSDEGQRAIQQLIFQANQKRTTCNEKLNALFSKFKNNFPALVQAMKEEGMEMDDYVFDHYICRSNSLRWINIDKFMKLKKKDTEKISVPIPSREKTIVRAILPEMNAIVDMENIDAYYSSYGFPKGQDVTIIVLDYNSETPRMAKHNTTVGQTIETSDFRFNDYSYDELKTEFGKLN